MLESRQRQFDGLRVQTWEGGPEGDPKTGQGFPVLMLHGVGPGTSIQGNFGPVLAPLAASCRIVATDLVGFGGSQGKPTPPAFDVELWLRQAEAMLDLLPAGPCGVAGHSLGGALALKLAARCPRITRVLTSSTVGARYALPAALDTFWSMPADRAALAAAMSRMVGDPSALTDAMIDDRWGWLMSGDNGRSFAAMFAAPRQRYLDQAIIADTELDALADAARQIEIVLLHGRADQACPMAETTLAIADRLPRADVQLFGRCGHNLPRERTADYIAKALALFRD